MACVLKPGDMIGLAPPHHPGYRFFYLGPGPSGTVELMGWTRMRVKEELVVSVNDVYTATNEPVYPDGIWDDKGD